MIKPTSRQQAAYKTNHSNINGDEFFTWINNLKKKHPKLILCGDYNIAHKEIDIHDPKGNKNSSGFLPEERKWMDKFFENGWTDTFRVTLSLIDIAGGASVFQLFVYKIKAGELII